MGSWVVIELINAIFLFKLCAVYLNDSDHSVRLDGYLFLLLIQNMVVV